MAAKSHPAPSRLQSDLAQRIMRLLKDQQAVPGHHLVELDLCEAFGVSRTPIRGALKLLADEGAITPRAGRGYVLTKLITDAPPQNNSEDQDDHRLFSALADARARGRLPDQFTQQELVRRFDARLGSVMRVLHLLAELGLVERKPGNGWAFAGDATRALNDSYALRRALEPQMLLQPGFKLDRTWAEKSRAQHEKIRRKPWRPGDGADFHAVNADFHEQLARCCGNRLMLMVVQRQNQLRRFLSNQWDYPMEQVHSAIDDHLEILSALEAGYNDKASALMLHHLTQSATQSQKEEAA
ncbi:MAG TPA: GntR family transcriptional regulator [Rhizomicrobium sp.]|jgi:DNA-binding GntR family transcriptional regulator